MTRWPAILFCTLFVFSSLTVPKAGAATNEMVRFSYWNWTNSMGTRKWIAAGGDSIGAGITNAGSGNTIDRFAIIQSMIGVPFSYRNDAVSGAALSAYIYNAAVSTTLPEGADIYISEGGINDINGGLTYNDLYATNLYFLARNQASNAWTIFEEIMPHTTGNHDAVTNYNARMRAVVATNRMCSIAPTHDAMADPGDNRVMNPAYTDDGQHPNLVGYTQYCSVLATSIIASLCRTSSSMAQVTVANTYTNCRNGDSLILPSGAAAWSSAITLTNCVMVWGNGIGNSFITNNVTTGFGGPWVVNTPGANKFSRITGLEFVVGTGTGPYVEATGSSINNSFFRLDNCRALWGSDVNSLIHVDTMNGVVDHNIVGHRAGGNSVAHVKESAWGGLERGNGAWTNGLHFNSTEFMFFEDNLAYCTNSANQGSAIDGQAGARYVWRRNTNNNTYVESHGSEASYERGGHAFIVASNIFNQSNINVYVTYFRGGSGLIYGNTINDVGGFSGCLVMLDNRGNDSIFSPYGGANGRNHWDSNDVSNPYTTGTATSAGALTVTDSSKSWTVNQWVGYSINKTSGKAVTSVTRSGTLITVTCVGHGFSNGNLVSLFGATQQEYNYIFTITSTGADTFTANTDGALPSTPATGTIYACLGNSFAEITANTATQLTFHDSVYGSTRTMTFAGGDTFEVNRQIHRMDQIGWTGGDAIILTGSATPVFPSAWNNQTSAPWYQWNNGYGNQSTVTFNVSGGSVINGRDTTNNLALAGFTEAAYPHFLVVGGAPVAGSDTTPPTLLSAVVNSAGTTITLNFDESVTRNSGTPTVSLSGGACTLTYSSGSGTSAHVYTLSRTPVYSTETGTLTTSGVSWVDTSANSFVDVTSFPITNNSSQSAGSGTAQNFSRAQPSVRAMRGGVR